jgi:hypothetical protein
MKKTYAIKSRCLFHTSDSEPFKVSRGQSEAFVEGPRLRAQAET